MKIKLIAAIGRNNELGNKGGLPAWNLKTDMKRFKDLTTSSVVVMGRKTYESFAKFNKDGVAKPLPNRTNVVITRDKNWQAEGVLTFPNPEATIDHFKNEDSLWIIGGGEMYKQFIGLVDELHITHIDISTEADTFFPEIDLNRFKEISADEVPASEKDSAASVYKIYTKKH